MTGIKRSLYGVSVYNPELLSKDELIQTFVARMPLLNRLMDALRRESDGAPQHHLLIGRRGMGKSTLLRRLRYAVEDDAQLEAVWLPLNFPEEQYNIGHLSDLWLNCLDALADSLENAGHSEHLDALDIAITRIQGERDEDKRQEEALGLLLRFSDTLGRRLILLIDNIDLVLGRLKEQEWALREVLTNEPRLLIVGATAVGMESTFDYGKAFYDFFRIHHLQGLDDDTTFEVMRVLAETTQQPQVAQLVETRSGRISALRLLAGGNPRTIVLLFNLLAQGSEGDVRSDLEGLLDRCTPLYKHRFEDLPDLSQRVVDALALHWAPMPAKAVADAIRVQVNVASAQLNRLVKDGVVEKVALPLTKRLGFQISERFFNIWYLMRASRRVRRTLTYLVEFLRLMYAQDELSGRGQRHLRLVTGSDRVRHAEYSLALAQAVEMPSMRGALELQGLQALCDGRATRRKLGEFFDLDGDDADLKTPAERIRLLAEAREAVMGMRFDEPTWDPVAFWELWGGSLSMSTQEKHRLVGRPLEWAQVEALNRILGEENSKWHGLSIVPEELDALREAVWRGTLDPFRMTRQELEAAALLHQSPCLVPLGIAWSLERGLEIDTAGIGATLGDSRSGFVHGALGLRREKDGRYEEAEAAYRSALKVDAKYVRAWNSLGNVLADHSERYDEAEAAYRAGLEVDAKHFHAWTGLGNVLSGHLGRYEEAEAAYRAALDVDAKHLNAWNGLGNVLKNHLGRYEEAEAAYRAVLEVDARYAFAWNGLGNVLSEHLGRYEEAEAAYRAALEVDVKYVHAWNGLGSVLKNHLGRYEEAEAAYQAALEVDAKYVYAWNGLGNVLANHLGRYEEAETAYRAALEVDAKYVHAWNGLGNVLSDHLGRYEEAEAAYRSALEADAKHVYAWNGLGNVLADHLGRYEEAEAAYRAALKVDAKYVYAWSNLASMLQDPLGRHAEAEAAYREAVLLGASPNGLAWHLYITSGDLAEAVQFGRTALAQNPECRFTAHTLACVLVATGDWPAAEPLARRFLAGDDGFLTKTWSDVLQFFTEVVRQGYAEQGLTLLMAEHRVERWRPLAEALEVAAAGSRTRLLALPPEVRQATDLVLARIAPELAQDPPRA